MRPETVPILLVALLLLSTQPGVESFTTVVGGTQEIDATGDAVLLVDGTVVVPEGETGDTSLYVLDGRARIEGTLRGDLVQLAGTVAVPSSGSVTGDFDAYSGEQTIAEGASVRLDRVAEPFIQQRSPAERAGLFALQALGLALVAFLAGRRWSDLLSTVGHSIRHHPVVSGTVGLLATVTLLALFVFMAFTIILLPVSVLGLIGGALVVLYAYVSVGYLLGERLPIDRPGRATAVGAVAFLLATELLGLVPLIGGLVPVAVLLVAVGAVVITYFGLREFHPPTLQPVESDA